MRHEINLKIRFSFFDSHSTNTNERLCEMMVSKFHVVVALFFADMKNTRGT